MALLMDSHMAYQPEALTFRNCYAPEAYGLPAGSDFDDLPRPSVEQAHEAIRLQQEIEHYIRENALWTECIAVILQRINQQDGLFSADDGPGEQFVDIESSVLQHLLVALYKDMQREEHQSEQAPSCAFPSFLDPPTPEDTLPLHIACELALRVLQAPQGVFDNSRHGGMSKEIGDADIPRSPWDQTTVGPKDALHMRQVPSSNRQVQHGLYRDSQKFSNAAPEVTSQSRSQPLAPLKCASALPIGPVMQQQHNPVASPMPTIQEHSRVQWSPDAMPSSPDPPAFLSAINQVQLPDQRVQHVPSPNPPKFSNPAREVTSQSRSQSSALLERASPPPLGQAARQQHNPSAGPMPNVREHLLVQGSCDAARSLELASPLSPDPVTRQQPTDSARPVPDVSSASHDVQVVSGPSTSDSTTDCTSESEATLVVKGVPARYMQSDLLKLWSPHEYNYNFLFLPYSRKQHRSVTYCFINFPSMDAALKFQLQWLDKMLPRLNPELDNTNSVVPLRICLAQVQGFDKNVLHVANDPKFNTLRFPPDIFDESGNRVCFQETLEGFRPKESGSC